MFREPWFRIIDVTEARGPSMADIVAKVMQEEGVSLADIRGGSLNRKIVRARHRAIRAVVAIRKDLCSGTIANFFHIDSSTVRHFRRDAA